MKIVVFGGSGFLGSHVSDKLSDAGFDVCIFDKIHSPWLRSDQSLIVGDILDEDAVSKVVNGADVVFNFAGIADIEEANERVVDTVRYNILGNTIIMEGCVRAKIHRYIFASSVYVYSKTGSFYRCSKQACEAFIESYQERFGLDYTILRYGSLYGPRSDRRNAIYSFVDQAIRERRITYGGNSSALREYIHVEDAAQCSVEILKPEYANQHIILSGHQPMTVSNLFRMISEILGKGIECDFQKDGNNTHYDVTPYSFSPKIGRKLSPPCHVDLGQGILRLIEDLHRKHHPELHNAHGVLVKR